MATADDAGAGATPVTVGEALARGREAGVDRLDLQLLLSRTLDRPRTWLLAHDDAQLTDEQAAAHAADLARRQAGEPLAYIVGRQEFRGLSLNVDRRVLIPRPDTEVLVDWAIERVESMQAAAPARSPWVLDLGTGSGAIALALKQACPDALLLATDASAAALQVAASNAERLGLAVAWAEGSWWQALEEVASGPDRFDLIVSNPPYIAAGDEHLAALGHEPLQALTPGGDGLASLRAIAAGAEAHLREEGWLLLEHGHDQGPAVRALLESHGFGAVQTRLDIAGRERCTGGRVDGTGR